MDKRRLLKTRLAEADVEVPGVGTMRVRQLSRAEVVDHLNKADRDVPGAWECRLVAMSLVDPVLTEDEVVKWRSSSHPAEIGTLVAEIDKLSALDKAADKASYKELEENADESFRVLPGDTAGDDGGPAEG